MCVLHLKQESLLFVYDFFALDVVLCKPFPSHHESLMTPPKVMGCCWPMVVEIMAASGVSELSRLHKCRDMWDIETNRASAVRCCNKQSAAVHLLSLLSGQPLEASLLPKKNQENNRSLSKSLWFPRIFLIWCHFFFRKKPRGFGMFLMMIHEVTEFNIHADPEAASEVFARWDFVTSIPLFRYAIPIERVSGGINWN